MAIPFAELNKINPSSVIELYELELTVGLHIPTGNPNNLDTVFRFHAGANLNNFGQIIFNGNSYQRVAVKAEGFEDTSTGTIPRPTITFSNLGGITKDTTVRFPNGKVGAIYLKEVIPEKCITSCDLSIDLSSVVVTEVPAIGDCR